VGECSYSDPWLSQICESIMNVLQVVRDSAASSVVALCSGFTTNLSLNYQSR